MAEEPKPAGPPTQMASTLWEGDLPDKVKAAFGDQVLESASYVGQNFFVVQADAAIPIIEFLKREAAFDFLVDLTAVDYPKLEKRFELVYILYSYSRNERIRLKTSIAEGTVSATAVPVHESANWLEREVFDMFVIRFSGHPNMTRILLPEEWVGHPLRKEYGITQMDNVWVKENLGIESGQ